MINDTHDICLNCDSPITVSGKASLLYCGRFCAKFAETVRYARRVRQDERRDREDVQSVIRINLAWIGAGLVYDRKLTRVQRDNVFALKGRLCLICGQQATEIDHINGAGSDDIENLQPLCSACHRQKTLQSLNSSSTPTLAQQPWSAEAAEAVLRILQFNQRVDAAMPLRQCDDDKTWPTRRRDVERQRREFWRTSRN